MVMKLISKMEFNPETSLCLDTGPIVLFTGENPNEKIVQLFSTILKKKKTAFVMKTTMIEVLNHLCLLQGKVMALTRLSELFEKYPLIQLDLNSHLIYKAGILKCQHRTALSYNDCISIAFCLTENISFHTTEKKLKKIPRNTLHDLRVVRYQF